MTAASTNHNRCMACEPGLVDALLEDTGLCGQCRSVADVHDGALVALYSSLAIPAEVVWRRLPRLRWSGRPEDAPVAFGDVEAAARATAQ